MSPYAKSVLAAIHFLALACFAASVVLYAIDLLAHLAPPAAGPPRHSSSLALTLKALPAAAGLLLFWKGKSLAIHWTRDLE